MLQADMFDVLAQAYTEYGKISVSAWSL